MNKPKQIQYCSIILVVLIISNFIMPAVNYFYLPAYISKSSFILVVIGINILYAIVCYFIVTGKNWARIVFTFFMVIGLLKLTMLDESGGVFHVSVAYIIVIQFILSFIAIYLFYTERSNQWYKTIKSNKKTQA